MKLLGLVLVLGLVLTACNQTDTTKNTLKDNNTNPTNVSNKGNIGKGQEYGGKGQGYGQVKKMEGREGAPEASNYEDIIANNVSEITHWQIKNVEVTTRPNPIVKIQLGEAPDYGVTEFNIEDKEMTKDEINYWYGQDFVTNYSDVISTPEGELYITFYKQ